MVWPETHFERFHDWAALRARRAEGWCVCGHPVDASVIDDFGDSQWCSRACFHDVALRCGLVKAPVFLAERDHGVCARCGSDAGKAARARVLDAGTTEAGHPYFVIAAEIGAKVNRLPVVEGGGGCGLDNYRTLCVTCHRGETATLATRRAETRRARKSLAAEP